MVPDTFFYEKVFEEGNPFTKFSPFSIKLLIIKNERREHG